jgi:hypothetical protein
MVQLQRRRSLRPEENGLIIHFLLLAATAVTLSQQRSLLKAVSQGLERFRLSLVLSSIVVEDFR